MQEEIRKDLLLILEDRIAKQKKEIEVASKEINQAEALAKLIASLESDLRNLKYYFREKLESVLEPFYRKEELTAILDRLEIIRLALSLESQGIFVDLNEEELSIKNQFINDLQTVYQKEAKKIPQEKDTFLASLDANLAHLNGIHRKLRLNEKGSEILHKDEIDSIIRIVLEEQPTTEHQISILCFINHLNMQIIDKKGNN